MLRKNITYLLDTLWTTFCNHLFGHSESYIIKNKAQPGRAIIYVSLSLNTEITVPVHKVEKKNEFLYFRCLRFQPH
jgi:hypothetical protein